MMRSVIALLLCAMAGWGQPQRIVSTSPSITDIVFALGLGGKLVGVSNYCTYPPEVNKLPKVGTYLKPNAELIARLSPDLVILNRSSGGVGERLTALGLSPVEVEGGTLQQVYSAILTIGQAASVPQQARALVGNMQRHLQHVRLRAASLPKQRILFLVGRRPGTLSDLVAVGPNTFLQEVIEAAGGINILNQDRMPAYPRISLETVLRLNPDVIVEIDDMAEFSAIGKQQAAESLWHPHGNVAAVRNRRVYAVPPGAFTLPGPRVVEAVDKLFQLLHPQARR